MADQDERKPRGACDFFADIIPDLASRAKEFEVDLDGVDEVVQSLFRDQVRTMVKGLDAALLQRNPAVIREHAHSLEGTGGTVGYPEISIVGWELSQAAKGPDWDRCFLIAERLMLWSKTLG